MKISIQPWEVRGKKRWAVYRRVEGKRKLTFFKTKAAAEIEVERLEWEVSQAGKAWLEMPADQRQHLMMAYGKAKQNGVDLMKMLEAKAGPVAKAISLEKLIDEVLKAKSKANRSPAYVTALKRSLEDFGSGRMGVNAREIDHKDVEKWLAKKELVSWSTFRARLSTMFKYAIRRGYLAANPCDRLEPVTVSKKRPAVFTVDEFKRCVKFLSAPQEITVDVKRSGTAPYKLKATTDRSRAFAWFVLSCCCGLRPEEAEKTTSQAIHTDEGRITVEAQTSKVRMRRVVYPPAEAIALLRLAMKRGDLPLARQPRRRALRSLRQHLGWKVWPKDVTRHTAASYWLAKTDNPELVAHQLGNSVKVLIRDYKALVTRAEAQEFWDAVAKAASEV